MPVRFCCRKSPAVHRRAIEILEERRLLSSTADIDPSFGTGGKNYTDFGGNDSAAEVAILEDGKILQAGTSASQAGSSIILSRYSANGALDASFGAGGKVTQAFHGDEHVVGLLVAGGKIYVWGFRSPDSQAFNGGFVARFNLDGSVDTGFSGGEVPLAGAASVAVASDGKVVVGYSAATVAHDFAITRLNPDGSIDTSFGGGDGLATLNFGSDSGHETNDMLELVSVQPSGKILAAGWLETYYDGSDGIDSPGYGKSNLSDSDYALARFNPDGSLDTSFGSGGKVVEKFSVFGDAVLAAAIGPQGQVAMSGGSDYLYHYGDIFSADGVSTANWHFSTMSYFPWDMTFQPDGKVVIVGIDNTETRASTVTRMTADGLIDERYFLNNEGQDVFDQTNAIAVAPDGKYIIGGSLSDGAGTQPDVMLTRVDPSAPHQQHGFENDPRARWVISAADYDTGGEGIAFHDIDPANRGGQYRAGGPDLGYGPSSGFVLGYTAAGEWLEYTINVPLSGPYQFSAYVANPAAGGQFHFEIDGHSAGGTIDVPATGSFSDFQLVTSQAASITAGPHVLRLVMDRGAGNGAIANFENIIWKAATSGGTGTGLSATYYDNMDFTAPTVTRIDPTIDFNWITGSPDPRIAPDTFSAVWTGQVQAAKTETYTFYTTSDDGVRLTVNGQVLIDHLAPQADTQWAGSIALQAGQKYDIKLEYIERYGEADVHLAWSSPSTPQEIIPATQLYPAASTADTTPPTMPANLHIAQTTSTSITMAWDASTDNVGVAHYVVTRTLRPSPPEDFFVQELGPDARSFVFGGLDPQTTYTFSVSATDAANNSPTASIQATTLPATSSAGLWATYYDNMDFTAPTVTRTDPTIDFNWVTGSPDPKIEADTFSARWTGFIQAPTTGTYTFYTNSDDGAKLIINGQTVINHLDLQGLTEWSGQINLTAGQKVPIEAEFFDRYGEAEMHLLWSGPGISKQVVPASVLSPGNNTPPPPPPSGGDGLSGTYYDNMDFTGFSKTRIDPAVDFDWGTGIPDPQISADTFSVRWTGQFLAQQSGTYTFTTSSDDGVRLIVNGQLLIDHLTPQALTDWSGQINLTAGQKYDITLEFFDRYGEAVAKLYYTPPGSSTRQIVPQSLLFSH